MALTGLRVVDLTDMRGALCARLLADLGADVLSTLPTEPWADIGGPEHQFRNANKRGLADDPATIAALLADADVLIDSYGLERPPGLGLEEIADQYPQLIHVALTDFGLTGPRAGWHLEALPAQAAGGGLHISGMPSMPPCAAPGDLAHDCASVYGAAGAVAAVLDRDRSGRGQRVEVAAQEACLSGTNPWSIIMSSYRHVNEHLPFDGHRNAEGMYFVFPAADGHIRTVLGAPSHWQGFYRLMGEPDALAGDEWESMRMRQQGADVIKMIGETAFVDRDRETLVAQALEYGVPIGSVHSPEEFVTHPHTVERDIFDTDLAGAPLMKAAWKLSATPTVLDRAAPQQPESSPAWNGTLPDAPGSSSALPLTGIRVIEFGVAAVVPELAGVLSELGAEIIKVESMKHIDVLRLTGGARFNEGFAFNTECRGRESVNIDISSDEGRRIAFDLCASADLVIENNRGGVMDKAGLGYDALRAAKPDIIYASSQGYGRTGPKAQAQAFGPLNACFSGAHMLWNHPDAPYPCGTSLNHPDHIAGKLFAVAVLAAIRHRRRTGEGQLLDMAQAEAAGYLMGERYLQEALTGAPARAVGNTSAVMAPHGLYPSAGEDRWLALAIRDDAMWERFTAATGVTLEAPTATLAERQEASAELDDAVAAWTTTLDNDAATELLQRAGVSAMTVQGPNDHHGDPHLAARDALVHVHHSLGADEIHSPNPIRFSAIDQRTAGPAPIMGADTEAVLGRVLDIDADRVAALIEAGVLA